MKQTILKLATLGAVLAVVGFAPNAAKASLIAGCDSGNGQLTVTPASATITFTNAGANQAFTVNTQGCMPFTSALVPTVPNGTTAVIQPLSAAVEPVDTPLNVPNFLVFSSPSTLTFTLTGVPSGTSQGYTPCTSSSVSCTVPGTPFIFSNTGGGQSTASFAVLGTLLDTAQPGNPGANSKIVFSATFNVPLQAVLASAATNSSITTAYAGTITASPVPEPATLAMMGLGMFGVAVVGLRRRRAKQQ